MENKKAWHPPQIKIMYDPSFSGEWVTIKNNRIFLESRLSFPDKLLLETAKDAVRLLKTQCSDMARVLKVFRDEKNSNIIITMGTTDKHDLFSEIKETFENIISALTGYHVIVEFIFRQRADFCYSERYDHVTYLLTGYNDDIKTHTRRGLSHTPESD